MKYISNLKEEFYDSEKEILYSPDDFVVQFMSTCICLEFGTGEDQFHHACNWVTDSLNGVTPSEKFTMHLMKSRLSRLLSLCSFSAPLENFCDE